MSSEAAAAAASAPTTGDPVGASAPAPGALCKECTEGYLWEGEPTGEEITVGNLPTYHAAPESEANEGAAILYLHDAFGWKFRNNRLQCDRLAKATGFDVYMPDLYDGTIIMKEADIMLIEPQRNALDSVVKGFQFFFKVPGMIMAMRKFNLQRTQPLLDVVVEDIHKKHGGPEKCKMGTVGYCWGGKYCLRLGAQGKAAAVVACHPSFVDPKGDNLKAMTAACLFIRAEREPLFGEKLWKETEACIASAGVPLDSQLWPGTTHGFAVRCSEADEVSKKARDEAFKRTADWFSKYLV